MKRFVVYKTGEDVENISEVRIVLASDEKGAIKNYLAMVHTDPIVLDQEEPDSFNLGFVRVAEIGDGRLFEISFKVSQMPVTGNALIDEHPPSLPADSDDGDIF